MLIYLFLACDNTLYGTWCLIDELNDKKWDPMAQGMALNVMQHMLFMRAMDSWGDDEKSREKMKKVKWDRYEENSF